MINIIIGGGCSSVVLGGCGDIIVLVVSVVVVTVAISRSSQCSTTGVTKAVVCVILSVGWCI